MKSIMVEDMSLCCRCGRYPAEEHHVIYGWANRQLSEKFGLKVPLCAECHRGKDGAHYNAEYSLSLKKWAQRCFEAEYPNLDFVEIFGRNYLWERS